MYAYMGWGACPTAHSNDGNQPQASSPPVVATLKKHPFFIEFLGRKTRKQRGWPNH